MSGFRSSLPRTDSRVNDHENLDDEDAAARDALPSFTNDVLLHPSGLSGSDKSHVIRNTDRVNVYREEGVFVRFQIGSAAIKAGSTHYRLHDISLGGLSLLSSAANAAMFRVGANYKILIERRWTEKLEAMVCCAWKERHRGSRLSPTSSPQYSYRIGFSFQSGLPFDVEAAELKLKLLRLPERQLLEGYIFKEPFYREPARVGVSLLGTRAIEFVLLDTQCLLLAGMYLEIRLSLLEATPVECVVQHIQVLPNSAKVFCVVKKFSRELHQPLVTELLALEWFTPRELRASGLKPVKTSDAFRFRYVRDENQYSEVLQLRLACYRGAGKTAENSTVDDMRAPLDSISRILVVYHGDVLIASCAMAFPNDDLVVLDTERTLQGGYPKSLPRKQRLIEVSRMCVDINYRGGDLLNRMFEQMYRVCLASDRDYMLSSADDRLWPVYRAIGFKKTPFRYDHPVFRGVLHTIILIHVDTPLHARDLHRKRWRELYGEVNSFMRLRVPRRYSLSNMTRAGTLKLLDSAGGSICKLVSIIDKRRDRR